MTTGSIQLTEKKNDSIVATGSIALHLAGQHDQGSHGTGGGSGGSGSGAGAGLRALDRDDFDQREDELVKARDEAKKRFIDNNGNLESQIKDYNNYADAENDLINARSKFYTPEQRQRLENAENAVRSGENALKNPRLGDFEREIFTNGDKYWRDEVARTKDVARGKGSEEGLDQTLGKSVNAKKGEWPTTNPEPPRKMVKVEGEVVDGVKVRQAYDVETANGDKVRVYDRVGNERNATELSNSLASMHELYPQKPAVSLVIMNDRQMIEFGGQKLGGAIVPGDKHIFVNTDQTPGFNKMAKKGWTMPVGKTANSNEYVLTHEYGHQYDTNNKRNGSRGLYEDRNIKKHLSEYGRTIPEEGYAEAFAEWHVSKGRTSNPSAVAYAKQEKWYGGDRIVATSEGAARYGVPIGGRIPEGVAADTTGTIELSAVEVEKDKDWDVWQIAKDLGIITMQSETESIKDKMAKIKNPSLSDMPMIVESWDPKAEHGPMNYDGVSPATEKEKKEAEKVVRETWKLLGLDYEE